MAIPRTVNHNTPVEVGRDGQPRATYARAVAWTVWGALIGVTCLAVWLIWRRLRGELIESVLDSSFLLTAVVIGALSVGVAIWRRWLGNGVARDTECALGALLTLAAIGVLAAIPVASVGPAVWLFGWAVAVAGIACYTWTVYQIYSEQAETSRIPVAEEFAAVTELSESEEVLSPAVMQQMTRMIVDGREVVRGMMRIAFAANERTQVTHFAFCPPLSTNPVVTIEQQSGPSLSVKVTEAAEYGFRVEVRRGAPATLPDEAVLSFEATVGTV